MKSTAWLDQQAAAIRKNRGGIPTSGGAIRTAKVLTDRFPELTPQQIGAVLMATGEILGNAWQVFRNAGDSAEEMPALLCCLVDTTGEYLYAPAGGGS